MNIEDINALLDNTATIETKIIVLPTEDKEEIVLTQEDSIVSWEYADKRYVPDKGIIGMFVERTLEGSLMNITPEFNIENRELELQLGVRRNDNGEYKTTFYSLGNFIVSKPGSDEVQDNTKYNAKDYTIKFNVEFNADYTDDEFTESFNNLINSGTGATAEWLARYTCKQVGVELADTDFANSDFVIFSNQFQSGDQCRDVMKAIGKLAYSWVRIGWDNKCHIDYSVKKEVTEEYNNIGKDNYYKLEVQKNAYGEVNKVVLGSSVVTGDYSFVDDKESIAENGETKIVINDNPILYTENLRVQALPPATRLFGLKYTPLTIETTGHPWLNGDDMISIIDSNGDTLYTYPFDRIISYGGHIRTTLSTYSDTEVEQEYTYEGTSSAVGERRQTRLELDRENQRIDAVVERQNKTEEQVAQFSVTLDEILSQISNIASITTEGRTSINNLMMYSLFGGAPIDLVIHPIAEHIDLTYPTYTIYPSNNRFTRVRSYLKIENLDGSFLFEYDLPELLYLDEDNYDEFEIVYQDKKCFKTKRIDFDENGHLIVLDTPQIIDYEFPEINMTKGDYRISVEDGYDNVYIYGKFVIQNDYTNLFATKVELNSAITQTEDKITTEVGKVTHLYDTEIENLNTRIEQTDKTIREEVTGKIQDLDGKIQEVEGSVELSLKEKLNTKDLFSEFNVNVNSVVITSDNFKLTETGHVEASDMLLTGGQLELMDDGTAENASIKIKTERKYVGRRFYENEVFKGYALFNAGFIGYKNGYSSDTQNASNKKLVFTITATESGGNFRVYYYWENSTTSVITGSSESAYHSVFTYENDDSSGTLYEYYVGKTSYKGKVTTNNLSAMSVAKGGLIKRNTSWNNTYSLSSDEIMDLFFNRSEPDGEPIELLASYTSSGMYLEFTDLHNYRKGRDNLLFTDYDYIQALSGSGTGNSYLKTPTEEQLARYDQNEDGIIDDEDIYNYLGMQYWETLDDGNKMYFQVNTENYLSPVLLSEKKSLYDASMSSAYANTIASDGYHIQTGYSSAGLTGGELRLVQGDSRSIINTSPYTHPFSSWYGNDHANFGGCYYYVQGTTVTINIGLNTLTSNAFEEVYQMPSDLRPDNFVTMVGTGSKISMTSVAQIGSDGIISVVPIGSGNEHAGVRLIYDINTW